MKTLIVFAVCAAALAAPKADAAGLALTGKAGSLGLGLELTAGLTDRVNVRVGGNTFSFNRTFHQDQDEFGADVKLRSITALLDVHPFGGGFRLSGGFVANRNEAGITGQSSSGYDIGDSHYSSAEVGVLTGTAKFKKAAGYAGFGFGNAVREGRKFGVVVETGVVFQGSPDVTLGANGTLSGDPGFQADLRREELNVEDDAHQFKYYPVFSFGISYKF